MTIPAGQSAGYATVSTSRYSEVKAKLFLRDTLSATRTSEQLHQQAVADLTTAIRLR